MGLRISACVGGTPTHPKSLVFHKLADDFPVLEIRVPALLGVAGGAAAKEASEVSRAARSS